MMMKAGKPMKPGWMHVKKMSMMVRNTKETEIDCGACYDQMDAFAEQFLEGKSPKEMIPLVQEHLDKCMDCREEYELLLKALKSLDGR